MKFRTLITLSIVFSAQSLAMGVVTDPASYSYYVNQIKEAQRAYTQTTENFRKEFELATKDLKTAIETKDNIFQMKNSLEGNYRQAQRNLDNFSRLKERMNDDPLAFSEKVIKDRGHIKEFEIDVAGSVDSFFKNDFFIDESGKKRTDWVSLGQHKKAVKQKAFKKAIVDAETARAKIAIQLDDLEALTNSALSSKTAKESMDVSNAIFLKMLENDQEIIRLLASISHSIALDKYTGTPKDSMKELNKRKNKNNNTPSDKELYDATFNPLLKLNW